VPKNPYIICKFLKIGDAEAWKISYQESSEFSYEL